MPVNSVNKTLLDYFFEAVQRAPQKKIIQIKKNDQYIFVTYEQFAQSAYRIAHQLKQWGIQPQDSVALCLENRPEWGMIYFGILLVGAIVVPFDPQSSQEDVQYFLIHSEAKGLFLSDHLFAKNQTVFNSDRLSALQHIVYLETVDSKASYDFDPSCVAFSDVMKGVANTPEYAAKPEEIASILYTSGTTGKPKGVMLTHRNFCSNYQSIREEHLFTSDHHVLAILPLHHSFPFMTTFIVPFFYGVLVTYLSDISSESILQCVSESDITVLVGIPQLYVLFYERLLTRFNRLAFPLRWAMHGVLQTGYLFRRFFKFNVSKYLFFRVHQAFGKRFRFFVSGGAKLDPTVSLFLYKLGFTLLEGYGLTETSPVVTINGMKHYKQGSVGRPVANVDVKIFEPNEQGIGEIAIKGPNVMAGYYKNASATQEVLRDGWFYSGDLGYLDQDRYLFITGRKKEIIVLSNGKNISPEAVETYYLQIPYIKEMCVLLGPQDKLMAVVVPDIEAFKKKNAMDIYGTIKWEMDLRSKQYAAYQRVRGFVITTDGLPRTRLGKLRRFLIQAKYQKKLSGEGLSRAEKTMEYSPEELKILSSDVWKEFEALMKQTLRVPVVSLNDHLELDLGVDSLGRAELIVALENRFDVRIPTESVSAVFTVKELFVALAAAMPPSTSIAQALKQPLTEQQVWHAILNQPVKPRMQEKAVLKIGFGGQWVRRGVVACLRFIFKVFWRLKVEGTESLLTDESFILCSNHNSYMDAFLIAVSVPSAVFKKLFFMGYSDYFDKPIIRSCIKLARLIPIDSGAHLMDAMQASAYVLQQGQVMNVFPEGRRSNDGQLQAFKTGVGILAKELNVKILPAVIQGSFEAWPRGRYFPKQHAIKVKYGRLYSVEELLALGQGLQPKNDYDAIVKGLRQVMKVLCIEVET